jgi:predicted TIM-barrel fold metal-dependent hydrolase
MDDHPNLYLDTTMAFALDSPVGRVPAIGAEHIEAHADRVVYGTDFPNIPYPYSREREGLERLGLSEDARQAIFHANAARLIARATAAEASPPGGSKAG